MSLDSSSQSPLALDNVGWVSPDSESNSRRLGGVRG